MQSDRGGALMVASGQHVVDLAAFENVVSWGKAVGRPGYRSLYESMVAELGEYLEEPPTTVAAACAAGAKSVADEWNVRHLDKKSPAAEVVEFYRTTKSYLFDLTTFNSEYPHTATLDAMVRMAKEQGFTRFLDFGSGIGSVGLYFAINGLDVTLADVSESLLDYASWRFNVRGLKVTIINLNRDQLPGNAFDLVTTFDVLEHLPNAAETLHRLAETLRVGGFLALNVEEADERFPQHITTYEEVLSATAAAGFRRRAFLGKTEVFERVQRNSVSTFYHNVWGKFWYGFLYRKAIHLLESLKIKKLIRRWIKGPKV
jgi:2-polyprenyl-3-methyl-5-hydroxy-6-metoxy-1,4-benzoquinol methylase